MTKSYWALMAMTGIVGIVVVPLMIDSRLAAAELEFEVASIRPKDPRALFRPRTMGPLAFNAQATLKDLIRLAYDLQDYQVVGGPTWIGSDVYDVRAKSASPVSVDQIRNMVATLLKQRFRLRAHNEERSVSAYALTVAEKGSKLTPAKEGTPRDGRGAIQVSSTDVVGRGATMRLFAGFLTTQIGQLVLDYTGLNESYDFRVSFGETRPAEASAESFGSMFSALKDLGLRLESKKKAPIEVLVVDSAQRPSAN